MMKGKATALVLALGVLLAAGSLPAVGNDGAAVGTVFREVPKMPGHLEAGEAIPSRGLVRTVDERAVVHLTNGQVLKLDSNSAALIEALSFDEVKVKVLSGRVTKWGVKGRAVSGGSGSWFVAGPSRVDPMALEAALLAESVGERPLQGGQGEVRSRRPLKPAPRR